MRTIINPAAWITAGLVSVIATAGVWADAVADFERLYGKEVAAVKATADTSDDLALARTLVKTAEAESVQPDMRRLLARQAGELAARSPEGGEVTVRAVELSAAEGTDRLTLLERIADVRQDQYNRSRSEAKAAAADALIAALVDAGDEATRTGDADKASIHYRKAFNVATAVRSPRRDEIKSKREHGVNQKRIDQLIESAKGRIVANPTDAAAAAELMNLYVVEKDNPVEARKYSFVVEDAALKQNVKLATSEVASLAAGERFDLGEWYLGLVDTARSGDSRAAMLRRARGYYESYRDSGATDAVRSGKADHALQRIDADLAALAPSAAPAGTAAISPGRWVDLLPKTDPAKHAKRGNWVKANDRIGIDSGGMSQIMFPVVPAGSYELSIKLTRDGGTVAGVYLPIGETGVVLAAGVRIEGSFIVHGLSRVDRREVQDRDNPTRTNAIASDLEGPKVLLIKVQIKGENAAIAGTLNGKSIVTWSGPIGSLDCHGIARSRNREAPGVFAWNSGIVIHEAKIRMTDGSAAWLADEQLRDIPPGEQIGDDIAEGLGNAGRRGAEGGNRDGDNNRPRFPGRGGRDR